MRQKFRASQVLYLILLLAFGQAVWLVGQRIWREEQNKNIEIAVGYNDVEALAKVDGLTVSEILARFKKAGILSVAVPEETLDSLEAEGRVDLASGPAGLLVKVAGQNLTDRIYDNLAAQIGANRITKVAPDRLLVKGGLKAFVINRAADSKQTGTLAYPEGLENLGLGWSPAQAAIIKETGLYLVPRLANSRCLNDRAIKAKIAGLKRDFPLAKNVIFSGDEVLGYPANLGTSAQALKSAGFSFGLIEFSSQLGAQALAVLIPGSVINVHSISPEEMTDMDLATALARWTRAAQERGLRFFYVHPFPRLNQLKQGFGQDLTEENIFYLAGLVGALKDQGFRLGPVQVIETLGRSRRPGLAEIMLLTLGVGVGALFLLKDLSRTVQANLLRSALVWLAGLVVLSAAFYFSGRPVLWQKMMAWLAAVVWPSWAVISCFSRPIRSWAGHQLVWALISITRAVLLVMIGAFLIGALLSQSVFFLRIDQFSGVKSALVLPFILVTYFFWQGSSWPTYFRRILRQPISLGLIILILLAGLAGALFVVRSGNYWGGIISPAELFLRRLLEVVLGVRPRTKEFLIGYPALILALNLAARGFRRLIVWFWAMVGTLGPVSLINSYCHLHTPFLISLRRSLNGYVLGLIFGLILIYLFNLAWLYGRQQKLSLMQERTAPLPFKS